MTDAVSTSGSEVADDRSGARKVMSRHTRGRYVRWSVDADHLNISSRFAGSPFGAGTILVPNDPDRAPLRIAYLADERLPGDSLHIFLRCGGAQPHGNTIRTVIRYGDGSVGPLEERTAELGFGEEIVVSLHRSAGIGTPNIEVAVDFRHFHDEETYGHIEVAYVVIFTAGELDAYFNEAGSDKGTAVSFGGGPPHCYSLVYEPWFTPWRDRSFNFLEIGLQNAPDSAPSDTPSLNVWRRYFPNAHLYGFDIDDFAGFADARTTIFQGDQSSRSDWVRFLDGPADLQFGIVLDDGSHASSHQQIALAALFPSVEPGGVYVIEDLHWQPFAESPTTSEVLRDYVSTGSLRSPFMADHELAYLNDAIDSVSFAQPNDAQVALIRKRVDVDR